jgi:hypothetical protein
MGTYLDIRVVLSLHSSPRVPKNLFPKFWSFLTPQKVLEEINKTIYNSFQ